MILARMTMKKIFKANAGNLNERDKIHSFLHSGLGNDYTVTIEAGINKKRSLSANALQAAWIKEISDWSGEDIVYVRRYIKINIGLGILLGDTKTEQEKEIASMVDWTLKKVGFNRFMPAQKLAFSDMLPVTSVMSSRQHTALRDQIKAHYLNSGLELTIR